MSGDGKRSLRGQRSDLPSTTLDGRVGDRAESAMRSSAISPMKTRRARPAGGSRPHGSDHLRIVRANRASAGRPGSPRAMTSASATSAPRDLKEASLRGLPRS